LADLEGNFSSHKWQYVSVHDQTPLFLSSIQIPLDSYLPTWKGNVIEAKLEMNPSRVVGMSLSLNAEGGVPGAKTGPGDFRLEVDWIKAMRTL
jgi:hypothetical protein